MSAITKRKGPLGSWEVVYDGRPLGIFISKGPAPKYREPQTYDVLGGSDLDAYLFEARSVSGAMSVIDRIVSAIAKAEGSPRPAQAKRVA